MRPITFSKILIFQEKISAVEDVFIEDSFVYRLEGQDFKTTGQIKISGRAKGELDSYDFSEKVDVDCLLSLAAIDCLSDLRLQFKDYMVYLDERIVRFNLRYELYGNGEKVLAFKEIAGEVVEEKVLKALNRSFGNAENERDSTAVEAKKIQDLIASGELDIIGAENLLPLLAADSEPLEAEEIKLPSPINEESVAPAVPLESKPIEPEPLPAAAAEPAPTFKPPLTLSEAVPEPPVGAEKAVPAEEVKAEAPAAKESLFGPENYVVSFFFVKVDKDDETYDSIAGRFNVDPQALRDANRTKPLSRGQLVKIPK